MASTATGCLAEERSADVIIQIAKPVLQQKKLYLVTKRVFDIVCSFWPADFGNPGDDHCTDHHHRFARCSDFQAGAPGPQRKALHDLQVPDHAPGCGGQRPALGR